jgi:archaellum component FlaF (FlaF/FlaG flagellin family)
MNLVRNNKWCFIVPPILLLVLFYFPYHLIGDAWKNLGYFSDFIGYKWGPTRIFYVVTGSVCLGTFCLLTKHLDDEKAQNLCRALFSLLIFSLVFIVWGICYALSAHYMERVAEGLVMDKKALIDHAKNNNETVVSRFAYYQCKNISTEITVPDFDWTTCKNAEALILYSSDHESSTVTPAGTYVISDYLSPAECKTILHHPELIKKEGLSLSGTYTDNDCEPEDIYSSDVIQVGFFLTPS